MVNPLNIKPVYQGDFLRRGNSSKDHKIGGRTTGRQPKRNAASIGVKQIGSGGAAHDSSESGYSADRESVSTANPSFLSINLHSSINCLPRYDSKCPKRRKRNEMQFSVTTIKDDLKRAGIPYKTIDTENIKALSALGNVNTNLKDHVQLVHSGDFVLEKVLNPSSKTGKTTRPSDYMSMFNAVRNFYPSISEHMEASKVSTIVRSKDTWSTPSTSSDVTGSDTESDSGSGSENDQNINGLSKVVSLSPLLDDFLESKIEKTREEEIKSTSAPTTETKETIDHLLSSVSIKPITMVEILQLSKTARIVTNSTAPFSIIHANAAFYNLLGKYATDAVIGMSLFSLLDPKSNQFEDELSLAKFMLSSSGMSGDEKKLRLLQLKKDDGMDDDNDRQDDIDSLNCFVRMSPILCQKDDEIREAATTVGYFAFEFIPESKELNENSSIKFSSLFSTNANNNTPMGVVA